MTLTRWAALSVACLLLGASAALAQDARSTDASDALSAILTAACRQNAGDFARYLTADNALAYQRLAPPARIAVLKRLVRLDDPGRPLLSNDLEGHPVIACQTRSLTLEIRFGAPRVRENLAFVPIEARVTGETRGAEENTASHRVEFGLVREGGGWKLLSVGLLLLDLPTLARRWDAEDLETREQVAINALRDLARAIETYRRAFGYLPEALERLGPAPKEGISPDAAGLVDAELAAGTKGGYIFRYRIVPARSGDAEAEKNKEPGYELAATPAEYGKGVRRSFFLDSSGTLRGADKGGALATNTDPPIEPR